MSTQPTPPIDMLALYAQAPSDLEAALAQVTEADLDAVVDDGKWTIRQIVHHMIDGDMLWTTFMKVALMNPGSSFNFDWYKGNDTSAEALHYDERAIEPVIQLFRANRLQMVQLLSLMPHSGENIVYVTLQQGTQPITVNQIVTLQANHAMEHISEIRSRRNT